METANIRNVVLLGHKGCGKTTLVESLAFTAKAIPQKGSVEAKNTISDSRPEASVSPRTKAITSGLLLV